jgi:hypothetical protein
MSSLTEAPRPLPPETAAWGESHLAPDDPCRRIGEQLYVSMHDVYAQELVRLPAPPGFTPVDLALLVGLGGQADLNVDAAAARLASDFAWKYALRLPLAHPGCGGDALWRFVKRVERNSARYQVPVGFIVEMGWETLFCPYGG